MREKTNYWYYEWKRRDTYNYFWHLKDKAVLLTNLTTNCQQFDKLDKMVNFLKNVTYQNLHEKKKNLNIPITNKQKTKKWNPSKTKTVI